MVTTFVVQTSQSLQVDYSQVTATLLYELIDVQRAAANGSLVNDVPRSNLTPFSDFRPTISDSLVNGLWFTSLSFSLATALFAVLTKQWIHQYIAMPSGTPRDRCRVRQLRYMGLEKWGVGFIIGLLPLLLSVSLGIFLVGLVLFLVPLQAAIASIVGTITFLTFAIYLITNLLPVWFPSCPYKTPLSQYIFLFYAYIINHGFFISPASSVPARAKPLRKFRDVESTAVKLGANDLDAYALGWLSGMTSNPSVLNIVVQSTGALPLRSVEPLMKYAERFSETYRTVISCMDINCQESTFDCLMRASLRFNIRSSPVWAHKRGTIRDRLSAETYAEVLCVDHSTSYLYTNENQIANLVKAQFMESSDKRLYLQPIVWAHLLQKLLPFTVESGLIPLFLMIRPDYWRADYKPPPLLPKNGMKIRSISYEDHRAVDLRSAIYQHLYPDIADAFCEGFMHVKDSIFHPDYFADEFPAPQDPRLLLLLTLAGSPSIRKTAINPSMKGLFVNVLTNTGIYMGIDNSSLSANKTPFELDSNRYAVLKLLYMLITSDNLSDTLQLAHQKIMLMLFLRTLNSTTPRPRFLPSDWCTPTIASNFTQIAFEPPDWSLSSDSMILEFVYEFLQADGPIANQIFSRFVSGRLLDRVVKLHGDYEIWSSHHLQGILGAFVSGVRRSDAAVAYLFELDNIFSVCAMFIIWKDIPRLHLLAQCCPDHPVWTECLQKLDTIPEHFELELEWCTREKILSTVSDFRVLFEGGEPPTLNPRSTVSTLWRRLRRRHGNIGKELTEAAQV